MAITALTDAKIYADQYDLSGDHNEIALEIGVREKANTVFGHTAESVTGALGFVDLVGKGYVTFGADLVHDALHSNIDAANLPVTIAPEATESVIRIESIAEGEGEPQSSLNTD